MLNCWLLLASSSQLLVIQSMTTTILLLDVPNHYKKGWSLVFKGVVWAEFKLLAGVVLIISFGPGSSAGKVGAYDVSMYTQLICEHPQFLVFPFLYV